MKMSDRAESLKLVVNAALDSIFRDGDLHKVIFEFEGRGKNKTATLNLEALLKEIQAWAESTESDVSDLDLDLLEYLSFDFMEDSDLLDALPDHILDILEA
jgi:hypothetical protein